MAIPDTPKTRTEIFLADMAGQPQSLPKPVTRKEQFLAKAAGMSVDTPKPITREEMYLDVIAEGGGGGGGSAVIQPLSVTQNGTYTAPSGVDGYSPVTVNVPTPAPNLQSKSVSPSVSQQIVTADTGYDGLSDVTVAGMNLQNKSLTVTENGTQTINPDSGYDGLNSVALTVNVQGGDIPDPTDGKTHLWIRIPEDTPANRMTFYVRFTQTVNNGVTVDWGDGSTPETYTGTSATNHPHTYAQAGDYEITLEVTSGTVSFVGDSSTAIYGAISEGQGYANRSRILRAYIGDSVTSIGQYAFQYCYSLASITIPDSITSIGQYAFAYCFTLLNITIPDSITSIGQYAFYICSAMSEFHFQPETPPTLANTNAFSSISTDCIFYVKYSEDHSILERYKTETNWSTYASRMREETV